MNQLLEAIANYAERMPGNIALQSGARKLTYAEFQIQIRKLATLFVENNIRVLGLHLDNGIDWVLVDLAAQYAGITLVPLPCFFSESQIEFIFEKANLDSVISFNADIIPKTFNKHVTVELASGVNLYKCAGNANCYNSLRNTGKITFTSGTTGNPKGVCLTNASVTNVAYSLLIPTSSINIKKHLSLLPLPTLLENIAGVYAPLLKGAICQLPSMAETGLMGAARFDALQMIDCLKRYKPHSIILLPQMLHDLVSVLESGVSFPESLEFIAVGGSVVSPVIIKRARMLGLPVYEGYGLSECCSVVALNTPQCDRPGSAGKTLNGIDISIADDNEIMVKGNLMQGYLGGPAFSSNEWLATGDIGEIDEDGYLYITGRKKNIFITSFGRNVSPEWTESELVNAAEINQVVVFGESRPVNCAVIVPENDQTEDRFIDRAIELANKNLPDYARVHYWIKANDRFSFKNGLATANGRLLRDSIYNLYEYQIESYYKNLQISGSN